ncbi:unnamed protein product [Lactuca virosa]|nr:unnamed protein product [Lactuca virosa]
MIDLPDNLALQDHVLVCISKRRDSVALLQYAESNDIDFCNVWMMEHGATAHRSFTKLFTVITPNDIMGFRKNGVPIIFIHDHDDDDDDFPAKLIVYEPNLQHNGYLEICPPAILLNSYMETLLLLDQV